MECHTGKAISELCIIDFGAGNGLLSVYLKYKGAKEIISIDSSSSCIGNISVLANYFGVKLTHIHKGDESTFGNMSYKPDVIIGTDVIEHIYDLDAFFSGLGAISSLNLMVFTTGSNPFNPFKVSSLRKLQWKDEYKGGGADFFVRETAQESKPYFEIRKDIIKESYPLFSVEELDILTKVSRGKRIDDIHKLVSSYLKSGVLPVGLNDKFSTCDPLTGNWTERIISYQEFKRLSVNYRFLFKFEWLQYDSFYQGPARHFKKLANLLIRYFPSIGAYIAPGWILVFSKDR